VKPLSLALIFLLGGVTASSRAATLPVANFSFESPLLADGDFTNGIVVDGFTLSGAGVQNATNSQFPGTSGDNPGNLPATAEGKQFAFLNGGAANVVYQDVGDLSANTVYTLTIALGSRLDQANGSIYLGFQNGINNIDGTLLSLSSPLQSPTAFSGTFRDVTFSFTTPSSVSGDLTIFIQNVDDTPNVIDNVRLTAVAVPEPASLALLLGGGGLLLWRSRCRRVR
jgi:hypothetical protein